jgi:hypothetical protein
MFIVTKLDVWNMNIELKARKGRPAAERCLWPMTDGAIDNSPDRRLNGNPWKRSYSCCHLWSWIRNYSVNQHLHRCFWVLCLFKLDYIIDYYSCHSPENKLLLVFHTTSVLCILHTLKHVEKFKSHDFKNLRTSMYMRNWDLTSFTLQNLYRQLSTFIIYCIAISIFPILHVLGLCN